MVQHAGGAAGGQEVSEGQEEKEEETRAEREIREEMLQRAEEYGHGAAGGGQGVDPKLATPSPVEQNPMCPGWSVGSPTLHSSERRRTSTGRGRGAQPPKKIMGLCSLYGKAMFS